MAKMTQQQLETHLWGAVNILPGKTARQGYKTYILTLIFFKRLSDQWDYEAEEIIANQERETGVKLNETQRRALLKSSHTHRFTRPAGCRAGDGRLMKTLPDAQKTGGRRIFEISLDDSFQRGP